MNLLERFVLQHLQLTLLRAELVRAREYRDKLRAAAPGAASPVSVPAAASASWSIASISRKNGSRSTVALFSSVGSPALSCPFCLPYLRNIRHWLKLPGLIRAFFSFFSVSLRPKPRRSR